MPFIDKARGQGRPGMVRVLVLGASGELGRALAVQYAARGVRLSLWGRDADRLAATAQACLAAGAALVETLSLDLQDLDAALAALSTQDDADPFEIALFAAGLGDIRAVGAVIEDAALVAKLGRVNFLAPSVLSAELGKRMALRGRGTLVLIGSAASFHALPFASAYAGSKAGLARFTNALRIALKAHGVSVTLVSPGFIDTAAGRQVAGPRPFVVTAAHAATVIVRAADRGRSHRIFPWPFAALRLIDRITPRPLRDWLLTAITPPGR